MANDSRRIDAVKCSGKERQVLTQLESGEDNRPPSEEEGTAQTTTTTTPTEPVIQQKKTVSNYSQDTSDISARGRPSAQLKTFMTTQHLMHSLWSVPTRTIIQWRTSIIIIIIILDSPHILTWEARTSV